MVAYALLTAGLHDFVEIKLYCDISKPAQAVLASRIADGSLDDAPIYDAVEHITTEMLENLGVEVLIGGFPCQDLAVSGLRHGFGPKAHRPVRASG